MNTKVFLVALLSLFLVGGMIVYVAYGSATPVTFSSVSQSKPAASLASGETLTLTSVKGGYRLIGTGINGSASATISLSIEGVFRSGYSLTLSAGAISFAGTSYAVEGGSAVAGAHLRHFAGTLETTAGSALFAGSLVARINGVDYYRVHIDLVTPGGEYLMTFLMGVSS